MVCDASGGAVGVEQGGGAVDEAPVVGGGGEARDGRRDEPENSIGRQGDSCRRKSTPGGPAGDGAAVGRVFYRVPLVGPEGTCCASERRLELFLECTSHADVPT